MAIPRNQLSLASTPGCVSTTHVNAGAANTWIPILPSRKSWCWTQTSDERGVHWLTEVWNDQPRGYSAGWAKVELHAGDPLHVSILHPLHYSFSISPWRS